MSAIPVYEVAPQVIRDGSTCALRFNVMPGLPVEETLHLKEYRVWERSAEAVFDRTYRSTMAASPDHLVFLTALAHMQKMTYLVLLRQFGFPYDPKGPERLKLWPTKLNVRIPKLYSKKEDVVQTFTVLDLKQLNEKTYRCTGETRVEDALHVTASGPVYVL